MWSMCSCKIKTTLRDYKYNLGYIYKIYIYKKKSLIKNEAFNELHFFASI